MALNEEKGPDFGAIPPLLYVQQREEMKTNGGLGAKLERERERERERSQSLGGRTKLL